MKKKHISAIIADLILGRRKRHYEKNNNKSNDIVHDSSIKYCHGNTNTV
jgi:hypothetical protein